MELRGVLGLVLFLVTTTTWALQDIDGFVVQTETETRLLSRESNRLIQILPSNSKIRENLRRLENGDYISGKGQFFRNKEGVSLKAINYVGLRKLLGRWRSSDGFVYSFLNFQTLHIHSSDSTQELHYVLTPDSLHSWTLLLIREDQIQSGLMTFESGQAVIRLFTENTGKVQKKITLKREGRPYQ